MPHRNTNSTESEYRENRGILIRFFFCNKSNDMYRGFASCTRDSVEIGNLSQSPEKSSFLS